MWDQAPQQGHPQVCRSRQLNSHPEVCCNLSLGFCLLHRHVCEIKLLPPATKLGQGYIFTGVCDSVHRGVSGPGGISLPSTPPSDQTPPATRHPPRDQAPPWDQTPPPQFFGGFFLAIFFLLCINTPDTVYVRAVCILLECFLVLQVKFSDSSSHSENNQINTNIIICQNI